MYRFKIHLQIKETEILTLKKLETFIPKESDRFKHIMGVLDLAQEIEKKKSFKGYLILAALYHDIGYSEKLKITKHHPIDSAFKAIRDNLDEEIVYAILHHTASKGEAKLKDKELLKYYQRNLTNKELLDYLTYCDTHIDSKGNRVSLEERLKNIYNRYEKEHFVYRNTLFYL